MRAASASSTLGTSVGCALVVAAAGADAVGVWPLQADNPSSSDATAQINLPAFARQERFGLRYRGVLNLPADGVYRFALASDDGARLLIDDALLIDRDGPQSPGVSHGSAGLARGPHAFDLRYFQDGGDRVLELEVSIDGGAPMPLPAAWLAH